MRKQVITAVFITVLIGVGSVYANMPWWPAVGVSQADILAVMEQLPVGVPIVYMENIRELIPDKRAIVVATGLYLVDEGETRAGKVYIFAETPEGWFLSYETNMDERVTAQGLPDDFEVSLLRIEYADVDGDELKEAIVFWNAEPWTSMSMIQFDVVVHIIDYDATEGSFREIINDKFVLNTFNELAFLLNVDCDLSSEIVLFKEIWEGNTCVTCAKRYRLEVWTVIGGELLPDPDWNDGQGWETSEQFRLEDCDCATLLKSVMQKTRLE